MSSRTADTASQLRVLHVIDGLGTGGAERSLAELLPRLAARDISSVVACSHVRDVGVHAAVVDAGFEVRVLTARGVPGRVRELRSWLNQLRPDLVHATLFESNLICRLAALGRVPVLSSLVSTPYSKARRSDPLISGWKLEAVRLVDALTARTLTAHFHALTDSVKSAAVLDLGLRPEQVTVVPRGRDPGRLGEVTRGRRSRARASLGVGQDDVVVLNVGRQEFQKGQVHLLEATARLRDRGLPVRTIFVGRSGAATGRLRQVMEQLGVGNLVSFLGHRDDVPDLLAGADVFAFPSLVEGLGGALLEAMALELPIVASRIPAISEVIEDGRTGRLVEPGNSAGLADAIWELAADPGLAAKVGREARARFLEDFTIDRVADRMANLYAQVLAR